MVISDLDSKSTAWCQVLLVSQLSFFDIIKYVRVWLTFTFSLNILLHIIKIHRGNPNFKLASNILTIRTCYKKNMYRIRIKCTVSSDGGGGWDFR